MTVQARQVLVATLAGLIITLVAAFAIQPVLAANHPADPAPVLSAAQIGSDAGVATPRF